MKNDHIPLPLSIQAQTYEIDIKLLLVDTDNIYL